MTWTIEQHDVKEHPWPVEAESVQCVVTSPPYWGLRDYGTARWIDGNPDCDHDQRRRERLDPDSKQATSAGSARDPLAGRDVCRKCGARRVDSQIGLETTPEEYVEKIVNVFRTVRYVLRPDGIAWLNLGDCYAGAPPGNQRSDHSGHRFLSSRGGQKSSVAARLNAEREWKTLKAKDLVGIPWRVAFALQADGWYLRSDVVWSKPNPMPESVRDRPTRSHEYLFLLTKSARYYYDQDAIGEPYSEGTYKRLDQSTFDTQTGGSKDYGPGSSRSIRRACVNLRGRVMSPQIEDSSEWSGTRNARTVWSIATEPFPEAHFATFPTELARRCILAGTSEVGACVKCGAPWKRVTERATTGRKDLGGGTIARHQIGMVSGRAGDTSARMLGWSPTCSCGIEERRPCLVLDPFSGAGTVALVSDILGRDAIGLELNPAYVEMSRRRVHAPRTDEAMRQSEQEAAGQTSLFKD